MTSTTQARICGQQYKTEKGKFKNCTKETDATGKHTGGHSAVQRKEYAPVTVGDLDFQVVVDPNERKALAPKTHRGVQAEERSDTLKQLDKSNQELYAAWVKAGKPVEYDKSPLGKLRVTPDKVESMRFLIRKSVQFIDHGLQFGDGNVKEKGTGRIVISWRVVDKRERQTNNNGQNGNQS